MKRVNEELSKFSSWKSNLTPTIYNSRQATPLKQFWYGSGSADPYLWSTIRIRILLFSSVTFMMPTKSTGSFSPSFFACCLPKVSFTSVFNDIKLLLVNKSKLQKSRFFKKILLVDGRIRIREPQKLTDPEHSCSLIVLFAAANRC